MKNINNKIPYGKNVYDQKEINAVLNALKKSTQMGVSVSLFEKKISNYFSKKYSLMVNSGSSALTLAFRVLDLPKNSEVITPCLNFGTAVSAIVLSNLQPVFIDCNKKTLQIDLDKIEDKISKKTKAMLIPNLIGNIPDWIRLRKIANKHKLFLIEDSADTLGGKIFTKPTGYYSDISICSFYGSHVISCAGNGGMFLTNNKKYYNKAKLLRSWGRMSSLLKDSENIKSRLNIKLKGFQYDRKFIFVEAGYNFEPSEIGAAFGLEQLKKLKNFAKMRNNNFKLHFNFFKKYPNFFYTPEIIQGVKTNFLAYPVILKSNISFSRKEFQIYLEKNNIQTRPIFSGNILRHPGFENLASKVNKINQFINTDYIMKYGLLIGCHQGLQKKDILRLHSIISKFKKIKLN